MKEEGKNRRRQIRKPKTEELLYLLLWSCEALSRPTWRNLTESFEGWAYRNGFHRQLARLEESELVESKPIGATDRLYRLTEAGRVSALGGRDPDACWQRPWDGRWRLVLFDVPVGQDSVRNRLRGFLHSRGFGYLQHSVWVTPHPLSKERQLLAPGTIDVESLILLEARPCSGESDAEIVSGAWDFEDINLRYANYLEILAQRPRGTLDTEAKARTLQRWARHERQSWATALVNDPLLPECLLPASYLGRTVWKERRTVLSQAAAQLQAFEGRERV